MGKIITLTDANNKEFQVDISSITDMTGDLSPSSNPSALTDADRSKLANFKVDIVDAEGNAIDPIKILDEAKADPSKLPSALDVTFEATHSGANRNYTIYHSDSMQQDMASWKSPFAKPMLKNHDMHSEPIGRVQDMAFGQSDLNPERDCIDVTYRISDKDAIEKILDGRYKTMSIGASVGHLQCNICGKDIVKDGVFKFCGHWKGDSYAGQTALWNAKDLQYKEGSIVNNPADDWAQVKKIAVVNGDSGKTKDSTTDNVNAKDGKTMKDNANILDNIDALANEGSAAEVPVGATTTDEANTATTPVESDTKLPVGTDSTTTPVEKTADEKLVIITTERDALLVDKKTLEDQAVITTGQVKTLTDEIGELKQTATVADEESKATRKQTIQLAVLNKKLMAQRVVDHETFNGTLTDDKKESRIAELLAKPAKEISDAVDALVSAVKKIRYTATPVVNPGIVADANTSVQTDTADSKKESQKTVKDFEDILINVFTRK